MHAEAGFTGTTFAEPAADVHADQVTPAGLCLEAGAPGSIREDAYEASDSLGTLHFSHWVPFEHNHLAFFTVYDGDFKKYIHDFAEKTATMFNALFKHVQGAPPTPVEEERRRFL